MFSRQPTLPPIVSERLTGRRRYRSDGSGLVVLQVQVNVVRQREGEAHQWLSTQWRDASVGDVTEHEGAKGVVLAERKQSA